VGTCKSSLPALHDPGNVLQNYYPHKTGVYVHVDRCIEHGMNMLLDSSLPCREKFPNYHSG
jgi:hypothetical protein